MLQWQKYMKSVPINVEKPPNPDFTDHNSISVFASQNVAAYMAGYLLRKIPIDNCNECSDQLLLPQLPSLMMNCLLMNF